jgi:hypothetical protein
MELMAADDKLAEELFTDLFPYVASRLANDETYGDLIPIEYVAGVAGAILRTTLRELADRGRLIPDGASVEEIGVRVTFPDGRVYDHWCGDWERYRRGVSPPECARTPLRRTRVSYVGPWEPAPEETDPNLAALRQHAAPRNEHGRWVPGPETGETT